MNENYQSYQIKVHTLHSGNSDIYVHLLFLQKSFFALLTYSCKKGQ